MGKRRGEDAGLDMQVAKESYNDDGDDSGGEAAEAAPAAAAAWRADEDTLKTRKIRKVNRKMFGAAMANAREERASAAKEPSKASSNPFASVNLLGGSASSASSGFASGGFGAKFGSTGSAGALGAPKAAAPMSGLFNPPGSKSASSPFAAAPATSSAAGLPTSSPFATSGASSAAASGSLGSGLADAGSTVADEEALKNVVALNSGFCKWVKGQLAKNPSAPLVDGVRNYIRYAQELTAKLEAAESSADSRRAGDPKQTGADANGAGVPKAESASVSGSSGMFSSFPSSSPTTTPAGVSFLFGGFGAGSAGPTPATNGGGLFGSSVSGSGLFGSGGGASQNGAAPASAAAASGGNGGDDDDDDEPEPVEQTVVEDSLRASEELVHRVKAKVLYLRDGEWASKGLGELSVIRDKETARSYVVLRSNSGRVTCNVPLYKSINTTVDEKAKAVRFAAVSYTEGADGSAEQENDGKPLPFMVRVKDAAAAAALSAKMQEAIST